jgi:hypothetical protein
MTVRELPQKPVDGQEIEYEVAPGVIWRLKWLAPRGVWECMPGG